MECSGCKDAVTKKCSVCGKVTSRCCVKCYASYYCSIECQRLDWNIHRNQCDELRKKHICGIIYSHGSAEYGFKAGMINLTSVCIKNNKVIHVSPSTVRDWEIMAVMSENIKGTVKVAKQLIDEDNRIGICIVLVSCKVNESYQQPDEIVVIFRMDENKMSFI